MVETWCLPAVREVELIWPTVIYLFHPGNSILKFSKTKTPDVHHAALAGFHKCEFNRGVEGKVVMGILMTLAASSLQFLCVE